MPRLLRLSRDCGLPSRLRLFFRRSMRTNDANADDKSTDDSTHYAECIASPHASPTIRNAALPSQGHRYSPPSSSNSSCPDWPRPRRSVAAGREGGARPAFGGRWQGRRRGSALLPSRSAAKAQFAGQSPVRMDHARSKARTGSVAAPSVPQLDAGRARRRTGSLPSAKTPPALPPHSPPAGQNTGAPARARNEGQTLSRVRRALSTLQQARQLHDGPLSKWVISRRRAVPRQPDHCHLFPPTSRKAGTFTKKAPR